MERKYLVCNVCHFEKEIIIYSIEEAREKNLRPNPPHCPKCGSSNVTLHDRRQ